MTLLCDTSSGNPRPLFPLEMRWEVFDMVHGLSYPGTNASVKMTKTRLVWHGLAKDTRAWVRACLDCLRAKVHRHIQAPLNKFEPPASRFSHIHVDLVGPLLISRGKSHLLTIIDRFTRWPETIPLSENDTTAVARASPFCSAQGYNV